MITRIGKIRLILSSLFKRVIPGDGLFEIMIENTSDAGQTHLNEYTLQPSKIKSIYTIVSNTSIEYTQTLELKIQSLPVTAYYQ